MKHLRWEREDTRPRHPYRDTAIMYAILAAIIVIITALTNGNLLPGEVEEKQRLLRFIGRIGAVPVAAGFFVIATGFSWWRMWKHPRKQQSRSQR